MSSWHSYPSIFNLGHRAVRDLLQSPHIIEEKVDGSQFSFGRFATEKIGEQEQPCEPYLRVRSKGAEMLVDAPEKMFTKAVETVKRLQDQLHLGWTYRGEYLAKAKHNSLAYDRHPTGHIILFDISTDQETWLGPEAKAAEARRLGLECVPVLTFDATGGRTTLDQLRTLIDTTTSVLGGQLIEGIVVKPTVELYGVDHKTLIGKFVSERFKEVHRQAWKVTSPNAGDIIDTLTDRYKVEGRWHKAVQHLREAGLLQEAPQDIPALLAEIQKDLGQEEKDEIQRLLWKWAWPRIARNVTRGVPEWWKEQLLKNQFAQEETNGDMHDRTAAGGDAAADDAGAGDREGVHPVTV